MRRLILRFLILTALGGLLVILGIPEGGIRLALAVPLSVDADGDGFYDPLETALGSNPADPTSMPESVAIPSTCRDGLDNDRDGRADTEDPGCQPPTLFTKTFPTAGLDAFDSKMILDDYPFAVGRDAICPLDFEGRGPTVIQRGNPVDIGGGRREIDTEIVAMQLTGTATILPDRSCPLPPGPVQVTIIEDPTQPSKGKVSDTTSDPARDFPSESFFDVFFEVALPQIGLLPGGPPGGPPGAPVQVTNTINSLPPYHSPGNPSLNPDCYTVPGLPHQHCPKPPLDHFKCYRGKFVPRFKILNVLLEDQFETEAATVLKPGAFCNPVDKDGSGIFDQGAHLEFYRIKPAHPFTPREVIVQNQFGLQTLTVERPVTLGLPSQKDDLPPPAALDHFKCYKVTGQPIHKSVDLTDQFGQELNVTVLEPRTLCNPVAKTKHEETIPIGDAAAHLVCYRIAAEGLATRPTVAVQNQFGRETVTVKKPVTLCVPSEKQGFVDP